MTPPRRLTREEVKKAIAAIEPRDALPHYPTIMAGLYTARYLYDELDKRAEEFQWALRNGPGDKSERAEGIDHP